MSPFAPPRRTRVANWVCLAGLTAVLGGCGDSVGGAMAPINQQMTVLDWMAALRLPVVVIAGSYLGTISHTLTALDVLTRKRIDTAALVVNESPVSPVPLEEIVAKIEAVIPGRSNRRVKIEHNRALFNKQRNRTVRMFGHLKINQAIAIRYDQLANSFLGMVHVVASEQPDRGWLLGGEVAP